MMEGESIVVTGGRMRTADLVSSSPVTTLMAEQEALGDLKLYRIPEPVTVAANSQKQVALLQRSNVEVAIVYRQRVSSLDGEDPQPVVPYLVTRNRDAEGLGLPLPAGRMAIFVEGADRPMLFGEGYLADRAIGNDVEIPFGTAAGVNGRIALVRERSKGGEYELVVTNDQARPIRYEAEFVDAAETLRPGRRLGRRDGQPLWAVTVPANGSATLRYRFRAARNGD
jgi:hypothetical protein